MTTGGVPARRTMLAEIAGEVERGGAGRPAEIARRLGPNWTEDRVLAVLADLFSDGVVGDSDEVGLWWVA